MSKEEANKFLKFQTCVLKLNICCDGCKKKVRRVLHKIEGVYAVTVDVEDRKVTVTGNVDPVTLIKKLNKAGKNAELWPAKGGGSLQNLPGMLQKAQLEHGKGQQKPQKGGGGGGGGIKEQKFQQQHGQGKGLKDLKFPSLKDLKLSFKKDDDKKVKFTPHPKGDFDGGSDYGDEDDDFEDEDDDYEDFDDMDDEFGGGVLLGDPKVMAKPSPMVNFNQPNAKGKKSGGGKGGDLVQVTSNAVGGKNGGGGGGGNPNQANGGVRKGHGADESKNGGGNNKNKGGAQGNHGNPSPNKGGGGAGAGGGVGLGRGLPMGQPNTMMGQMGSFPATTGGMPHPGYFPPGAVPPEMMMAGGNPYQQQQYLQALMQQQQQQRLMMMNGQDRQLPAFSPMQMGYGYGHGYGRPVYAPPPLPPMPAPAPPLYPHHGEPSYSMFSDENPNSCSVM